MTVEQRIFIVGCPRSGTSLVQSLLVATGAILSLPETHFLATVRSQHRIRRRLRVANPAAWTRASDALMAAGASPDDFPAYPQSVARATSRFVRILDDLADRANVSRWAEKTPRHLHAIDLIERHIPRSQVVHVLREPAGAIASLYEVTNQHPGAWSGHRTVSDCIRRWDADLAISVRHLGRPGHSFVLFDRLRETPEPVLEQLLSTLGLPANRGDAQRILALHGDQYDSIVLPEERPWKHRVRGAVDDADPRRHLPASVQDQIDAYAASQRERLAVFSRAHDAGD